MANEVRLIDANALDALEDLKYNYHPVCDGDAWYRADDVWKCIDEQPTIDPESLRPKGRWIKDRDGDIEPSNADRIRAMSDEELAKILNAFTAYFEECNRSSDDVECKNCELYRLCSLDEGNALEWLKQPAEPPREE